MELLLLVSFGLAALLVPFASGHSDDGSEAQEPEVTHIGSDFTRDEAGTVTGTQGDDLLTYQDYLASTEEDQAGDVNDHEELIEEITAGAGNDTIDLMRDDGLDELIWANGDESVYGGAGDDVIHLPSPGGVEIYGGAGRDDILVGPNPSLPVSIFGGLGSDTLDGSVMDNGYLHGEGGNDVFRLGHPADLGTGYVRIAYGGAGQDRLSVDATTSFSPEVLEGGGPTDMHDFYGGEGRDSLSVTIHEGLLDDDTILENGKRFDEYLESYLQGQEDSETEDGDVVRLSSIEFEDFVKGEDRITLNVSSVNDNFDLAEIRMEERLGDDGTAETVITASYESETFLTREVSFSVKAVGLTWEDIGMKGVDPALLSPVVRLA